MGKFDGKRLLLLGSNVSTLDIIKYANNNGAYTVVADNLPVKESLGKQFADEAVCISTADIEGLKSYIRENHIDGIFAGVSEFNLLKAMELCEYFSLPFYCSRQQWDLVENKERFRELCQTVSVPCPTTYYSGENPSEQLLSSIPLPVVVKPVDASASIGVSICRDSDGLKNAVQKARENSRIGRVIIEEFFEGEEFSAHYSVVNGKISLSCVDNRIPIALHEGSVTTVPLARIYPSSFIEEYISQVDGGIKGLIQSLGVSTGILFIQGLYNKRRNHFSIFEAGLRCSGEAPYRFLERVNGINFLNNLVDYALLGCVEGYDVSKEDPFLRGKHCCVISFVSRGGTVDQIIGYDETIFRIKSLVDAECRYHPGDIVPDGDTLRQIVLRFVLVCDTLEEMIADIMDINRSIQVLGIDGEDMCYRFDTNQYSRYSLFKS